MRQRFVCGPGRGTVGQCRRWLSRSSTTVPDLVVTNGFSNNVSILLGKGDATYHAAVSFGAGTNPVSVTVADFDGDGRLDLAVANADSADVSVLLGRGDGTFKR